MSEVKAGNGAAVAFNGTDVKVTYDSVGTKIDRRDKQSPKIYIPITNPASTSLKLDFAGGGSGDSKGKVTDMEVYDGATYVYKNDTSFSKSGTFSQSIDSQYEIADFSSYGILVTLTLSLPDSSSSITLYSVDLTFK